MKKVKERKGDIAARSNYKIHQRLYIAKSLCIIRNRGDIKMSLKDKLDKRKEDFKTKAPQDAQEIMHRATEDLKNSGIMDHVVKIGDKAPDFTLKDTEGQDVSLRTLLGDGPVVLTFYRGNW
jgi:hypothetical protein